jgi:uncharacterized protein DUF2865
MTRRSVPGLPKTVDVARLAFASSDHRGAARRRRTLAAFLTGAGLLVVSLCSLEAGVAAGIVNSSSSPIAFILSQTQRSSWTAEAGAPAAVKIASSTQAPQHKRNRSAATAGALQMSSMLSSRPVCVRLCDGYFFPAGPLSTASDTRDQEAACSSQCPDAPTELFVEPAGSDKIEDAVSRNGAKYSSLPMAFSNRIATDKTCSCHRHPGEMLSLANDATLRSGDSIMTPTGIVVFRGSGRMPYGPGDFTNLARASMPNDKRAVLVAIERAALPSVTRQPPSALASPNKPHFTLSEPSIERSRVASSNNSIHFVEPMVAATN